MTNPIQRWFAGRPVRVRLTLWYILAVAATLLILNNYIYVRVEHNMAAQVDSFLQAAAAQAAADLEDQNGQISLDYAEIEPEAGQVGASSFAVRLTDDRGTVLSGWGSYESVPAWLPVSTSYLTVAEGNITWRLYSQPVAMGDGTTAWLQVAQSLTGVQRALGSLRTQLLLAVPVAIALAGLGGFFLSGRALRPVNEITRTAEGISGRDLTQRINYRGAADEIGHLAKVFDRMLDRLKEAFDRERRFTADVAHELRTPLTILKGQIGVTLSSKRSSAEHERTLQSLEQEVDRLIRLTNDLLLLSRLEQRQAPWQPESVDISDLLSGVVEQMQPIAETKGISIDEGIQPGLHLLGAPDQLIRLFLNLLDNAIRYTQPGGRVEVGATIENGEVIVTVSDNGPGIPSEYLPHVFDRFYRVDPVRSRATGGAGLGLAIAREIARWHKGALEVSSEPGRGTTFTTRLPAVQSA
jgi:heavy metal sensor kinase